MSLQKGCRKRKENEDEMVNLDLEKNSPDINGVSNGSKKLKISNEGSETGECFGCKVEGTKLVRCSLDSCDKLYHKKCLEGLPSVKTDANLCPLHICLTCYNAKNSQITKGDMLKCEKCPLAVHDKDTCKIPGMVVSEDGILCPKHFSPEKHRDICGIVKLPFCVECGCNEDLIFCKTCPAAIHIHCLKRKPFIGDYKCDRCCSGKTVLFNDVVWARVYDFRWWPAQVVDPNDADVEIPHFDGEFPVKFFGSDEHYWVNHGRVYPFFYRKINIEQDDLKHNPRKIIPNRHFDAAVQLALTAMANHKIQLVSVKNNSNSKPPPFKYVKCNKPVGNVQVNNVLDVSGDTTCGCKAEDKDPCGYDSMCLNRSMCTECYADLCEAGAKCQNQKFQKAEYVSAKPYWTEVRGWGLKCEEDIKKGTFIAEYCGDLIDEEEMNRRIQEKTLVGDTNFYFCTLDANRIIDAGPKGCISRFMNHSCDPNCETQKWMVLGDARVGIFAKRDIKAGTELTFDYQMDFSHFDKLKCNCGAKHCAGLIGKKLKTGALHSEENDDSLSNDGGGSKSSSKVGSMAQNKKSTSKKQNGGESSSDDGKMTSEKLSSVAATGRKRGRPSTKSKIPKQNGDLKDDDEMSEKLSSEIKKENIKKQNGASKSDDSKSKKEKGDTKSKIRDDSPAPSSKKPKISAKLQNGDSKNHSKESDDEDFHSDDDDFKVEGKLKSKKEKKSNKPICFKCKTGGKMIDCSVKNCAKCYHTRCLAPKQKPSDAKAVFKCPSHFCRKCQGSSVYVCYLCPNAYCEEHVIEKPGSGRFTCPKHGESD